MPFCRRTTGGRDDRAGERCDIAGCNHIARIADDLPDIADICRDRNQPALIPSATTFENPSPNADDDTTMSATA